MFFRKREAHPPLDEAMLLVWRINELAYGYKRDRTFMPDEDDLLRFERLCKELQSTADALHYITHCMHRRADGQPEEGREG